MYKITSIKDKSGIEKVDFYNEMQSVHPSMGGEILYPELTRVGSNFCLLWDDDSDRMLRTSTIEEYINNGDSIEVVTRNSVYTLEKVENK